MLEGLVHTTLRAHYQAHSFTGCALLRRIEVRDAHGVRHVAREVPGGTLLAIARWRGPLESLGVQHCEPRGHVRLELAGTSSLTSRALQGRRPAQRPTSASSHRAAGSYLATAEDHSCASTTALVRCSKVAPKFETVLTTS